MAASGKLKVSNRGQMSLPSSARHRWGLDDGGDVGFLDLGDSLLLVPSGLANLRDEILGRITDADWVDARRGFGDPELASE